jgi:hypothetical protein
MKKIISQLNQFKIKISQVEQQNLNPFEMAIKSLEIYKEFFPYFIDFETNLSFKNLDQEVCYFGEIKPEFLSHFFYLKKIIEIENSFSFTNDKYSVIHREFENIRFFKQKHAEILMLYHTKNKEEKNKSFTSANCSSLVFDDNLFSLIGETINKKQDVITSYLIACDKIELYLIRFSKANFDSIKEEIQIKLDECFTAREVVELAYALYYLKGGKKTTLKKIIEKLSFVFNGLKGILWGLGK